MCGPSSKLLQCMDITSSDCWLFTAGTDSAGYGRIWSAGGSTGAHMLSYKYHKGNIPTGLFVLHTCDNPPCCNPEHLFLGTKKDNAADMFAKGRAHVRKGINVNTCKLTEEEVIEIRSLYDQGYSQRTLGEIFGVSHPAIGRIVRRQNWRHI